MSVLETATRRVLDTTTGGDPQAGMIDVATIAALAGLLLQLYQQCRKNRTPEQIKASAATPSLIARLGVRRQAIKQLGWSFVRAHGEKLVDAVFSTAAAAAPGEYADLEREIAAEPILHD